MVTKFTAATAPNGKNRKRLYRFWSKKLRLVATKVPIKLLRAWNGVFFVTFIDFFASLKRKKFACHSIAQLQ